MRDHQLMDLTELVRSLQVGSLVKEKFETSVR